MYTFYTHKQGPRNHLQTNAEDRTEANTEILF